MKAELKKYLAGRIAAQPQTVSHLTTDQGFDKNAKLRTTL